MTGETADFWLISKGAEVLLTSEPPEISLTSEPPEISLASEVAEFFPTSEAVLSPKGLLNAGTRLEVWNRVKQVMDNYHVNVKGKCNSRRQLNGRHCLD